MRLSTKNIEIYKGDKKEEKPLNFQFCEVFSPASTQEEIYNKIGKPMVNEVMNGYNCTIFVYGQTGSGKTYTMMGTDTSPGILPRILKDILSTGVQEEKIDFDLTFIELYREIFRDLLLPPQPDNLLPFKRSKPPPLQIREYTNGDVYLQGAYIVRINSFEDVLLKLQAALEQRAQAPTLMNETSSRSHAICTLTVRKTNLKTQQIIVGKLHLVDLAGSEKVSRTGASGVALKEAQATNTSLLTLRRVIDALNPASSSTSSSSTSSSSTSSSSSGTAVVPVSNHVPYRNSGLTRLLQDSLGGNAKTSLLVTVSPLQINVQETVQTLRFGGSAGQVINAPKINVMPSSSAAMSELAAEKALLKSELEQLHKILESYTGVTELFAQASASPSLLTLLEKLHLLAKAYEQVLTENDGARATLASVLPTSTTSPSSNLNQLCHEFGVEYRAMEQITQKKQDEYRKLQSQYEDALFQLSLLKPKPKDQ
ncbi:unnamed protein product [Sphagnum jensenii]|uniref:Kinesin-like protein n=1 Tax=Sphagnum jensenii TaxID=128206 RepID=A0ABP0VF07_9BRYO